MTKKDIRRLYRHIDVRGKNECWNWKTTESASQRRWNYGSFYVGQKVYLAHRVVLEVKLGRPIEPGKIAMHSCDNPSCCNPKHLSEGTHKENSDHKVKQGRAYVNPNGKRNSHNPVQRLLDQIDLRGENECWLWLGGVRVSGIGVMKVFRRLVSPARLMLEIKLERSISRSEITRHRCDNPICCNPDHLEVGSQADNVRDAQQRRHYPAGESHHNSHLTEKEVVRLRERYANEKISCARLEKEEGLPKGLLAGILQGRRWRYAGGPIAAPNTGRATTRLNEEAVRSMRRQQAEGGVDLKQLAEQYGVQEKTIWKAIRRESWKSVET